MTSLFLVSIGPVQTFIASARRTRDLWFGSWLLSELSKAAAHAIVNSKSGNSLIFPAPPVQQLQEFLAEGSKYNVANKIVALIDEPPADLGDKVYKAIERRLNTVRDQVFNKITDTDFDRTNAKKQVADLIEYFWVALPFDNANYTTIRRNLEALLVARKNTRDFKPVDWGSRAPKSSLDGQLESVIPQDLYQRRGLSTEAQQRKIDRLYKIYNTGPAEQLSGVDLLKRLGNAGEKAHFPSTSHIAALPYLARLSKLKYPAQALKMLDAYVAEIKKIAASKNLAVTIDTIPGGYKDWEHTILGDYDASLLFEERLVDIVTDIKDFEPAKEILRKFYAFVERRPDPYYAILVADGDFMGTAIDAQTKHTAGPARHREISQALADFAEEARKIVTKHVGVPVYTGGDDVMAFMPLHTVLDCAKELAAEFHARLSLFPYDGQSSPTLSVGIAVAHHLEPLRDVLRLARDAEKQAKAVNGKNALAIRVSKRSGEERTVVGHWGELDQRIARLMELYQNGDIPEGMSYELRAQARRLAGPDTDEDLKQAKLAEAKRILQRKLSIRQKTRGQASTETTEKLVNDFLEMLGVGNSQGQSDISLAQVEEFATELMVARTLADAVELTML